jgi:integrase
VSEGCLLIASAVDQPSGALKALRFAPPAHTCGTLLLAQGVHPKVVQEILGHSQISLALDTYSHLLPHVNEEAAQQMDAALGA